MTSILLGHDHDSGQPIRIPTKAFGTHFHFIGGTGKGKTTAIHTLLKPLLTDPFDKNCFIIIDRLGNLSEEILLWMASPDFCTDYVRDRLVYIQPSREDVVLPFNPLLYDTPAHGYFKVERTTEVILRAWESVNISAMPRLARWTFNAFWAAAQLGLTVSDCIHFLFPGSEYHKPLLAMLPQGLQTEWREIYAAKGSRSTEILDSSRNRLKPYFESDVLRRMFGATENRLDIAKFMREGKIVLLDLAPKNRLSPQLGNTIGSLALNEIIATARSLPRQERYSTYIFLDEFQNFVGPDLVDALPEVRQLGLKFLLSHQSLSQLERGDYDLTQMIFQAQSRLAFGIQGEDADTLAHEYASIMYDGRKIKDEIYSQKQLIKGHKIQTLSSWSTASQEAENWQDTHGKNWSENTNEVKSPRADQATKGRGSGTGGQEGTGKGGSFSSSKTEGGHETLVPIYDNFQELSSRNYVSFDEQASEWAQKLRNLITGQALLRLVDDPIIRTVDVKLSTHGYLRHNMVDIAKHFPQLLDNVEALLEKNFKNDMFVSAQQIDQEAKARMEKLLYPTIVLDNLAIESKDPFA